MIPIQSHTLAAKCRSGTKGYYKRKRANGNYYFQVQVKLTHNKKENYIFSRNYDFEHHAKIAFALVTHKEYDLFHDEYLRMVTHVDTIGKVTIDELRQIMFLFPLLFIKSSIELTLHAHPPEVLYAEGQQE